jgi:hypothetical protein
VEKTFDLPKRIVEIVGTGIEKDVASAFIADESDSPPINGGATAHTIY